LERRNVIFDGTMSLHLRPSQSDIFRLVPFQATNQQLCAISSYEPNKSAPTGHGSIVSLDFIFVVDDTACPYCIKSVYGLS